jgi:dihydrodipicolinate synthase/N-acetylneuraminate lyase
MPGSGFVELYTLMWRHWTAGDVDAFRLLHSRLLPYLVDWMSDVEHAVATDKHIAMRRGLIRSDMVRQPGWVIDDRAKAQADHFIDEFAELLLVRGDSGRVL